VQVHPSGPIVQSVLALAGGRVLALAPFALYRSDDHGTTWRKVVDDNFNDFSPMYGGNKMDRSPYRPWAFIFADYNFDKNAPGKGSGSLYFYELDTDTLTKLQTPQGRSRGPFVRVSSDTSTRALTVWLGHGWDGYRVTRKDAAEFHALAQGDWTSFIATAGIHADMSDLGVDGQHVPRLMGSDGGLFKPRELGGAEWVSAAVPGSGMNSLQITDLAGTNIRTASGGTSSTSLYFGTQDNWIWASPDGGRTWPGRDCAEGFDLEVRHDARPGEPVTVGYVEIGCDWGEQFADANFANQRLVPDLDQNGQALDSRQMLQAFYLEQVSGGAESSWLRLRSPAVQTASEIYVSMNSGANWRKRFDFDLAWAGSVQRTNLGAGLITQAAASARVTPDIALPRDGVMAWVAVFTGLYAPGFGQRIGLVPLSNLYADRIDAVDDSDIVLLPGSGSLGRVFTQWDWHAVFGVDPDDWRFVIAPDVVAGDVKVTRDGGQSWTTDQRLTVQALRGGQLLMRDGDDVHMQVTEIAFDPYRNGRILVGTRDAGIVCTSDNGVTWRTISGSDRVGFITGFHFYPNGAVHIASWGHGIWYLKASSGCSRTDTPLWIRQPVGERPDGGVLARTIEGPPAPRGVPDPARAKLFLTANAPMSGGPILGLDNQLRISGRGLPAGSRISLVVRDADIATTIDIDDNGRFSTVLQLPENLPFGVHTIEAVLEATRDVLAAADFAKSYAEDEELEREMRGGRRERE
jgi:hypothetical protein